MVPQVLEGLRLREDGCYVDCTYGRGGHSAAILQRLGGAGRLFAFDKDAQAIRAARGRFARDARFTPLSGSFCGLEKEMRERELHGCLDGVLFDLGVSSPQLEEASRGFSLQKEGILDMRMNQSQGPSAAEWLAQAGEREICRVLRDYGEERFAGRIARALVRARHRQPIRSTRQLAALISAAVPHGRGTIHLATRSFQALRIHLNNELEELRTVLQQLPELLAPGGRLLTICFHSLEDRIVKRFLQSQERGGVPAGFPPLPVSPGEAARLSRVGRPQRPTATELARNPRARSAILRVAERLPA